MNGIYKGFEEIPPNFQILLELTRLLKDEYAELTQVVSLIKTDAGLASAVVRLSNCAYFGCSEPSKTIDEAVQRIGFSEVVKLVSLISHRQFVGESLQTYSMDADTFWRQSLASAVFMEFIAYDVEVEPGIAYLVGLLSEVGKYPISALLKKVKPYLRVEKDLDFIQMAKWERQECNYDHAKTGSGLLELWGFHQTVYQPIGSQIRPLLMGQGRKLASMLHITRIVSPCLLQPHENHFEDFYISDAILGAAGLDRSIIEGYLGPAVAWLRTTNTLVEQELMSA